jgi:tetratricopeptide (TPR) repeat protein
MSVLFDGLILMESLIFFLESLLIWNWLRIPDRGASVKQFAWLGLLTGLLASARGTALLLLPATLWLANRSAGADRRRLGKFVAVVAGTCLVVVLPLTAWNYGHGGEFIPLTYNFGYNLFVGNNPDATGGFVSITGTQSIAAAPLGRSDGGVQMDGREYLRKTAGADLTPAKSSAYWTREAASFARVHPERIAELIATKILLLFNRTETPQLEIIDLFRREAGPLGVPLLGGFLFVGILGLSGLASRRLPALPGSALRLYVLGTTIGVLPFFVTDRYRYHLIPALAVLAAQGIEDLLHLRAGNSRERTRTLLFGACALILVCAPITGSGKAAAKWDQARELGTRWLDQGRPDLAVAEYERAMKLGTEYSAEVSSELNFSEKQARLHFDYAAALHRLGRSEEALSWLEAAAREDSTNARYVRTLSDAYLVDGRGREADSLNQRLRSLVGSQAEALIAEGWRAARAGLMPEAERAFRAAVSEDQRQFGAWGALIRVQVQRGEWSSADSSLAQARRAGMSQTSALVHEALIAATSGDLVRARRALDAVPPGALDSDPMLRDISEAMARKIRERDRTPAVPGK